MIECLYNKLASLRSV